MSIRLWVATFVMGGACSLAGENVEVRTTSGPAIRGELLEWNDSHLQLRSRGDNKTTTIASPDLMAVTFSEPTELTAGLAQVCTMDGGRIAVQSFVSDGKQAVLETRSGRRLTLAVSRLAAVLLQPIDKAERSRLLRETNGRSNDLLIVIKDQKRLEMAGLVTRVEASQVFFQLDGEELPVARQRIWGWIYGNRPVAEEIVAEIHDRDGAVWPATAIRRRGDALLAQVFQQELEFPLAELARVDLARGKLTYLSDLEPALARHTPLFDTVWTFQRDRRILGGPIKLDRRTYDKGLSLHSQTELQYDLSGRYREFRAEVGLDGDAGPFGDCILRIRVDDKVTDEKRLRAKEKPMTLVVPLLRANRLTLEVDYGEGLDLGDHVLLGDARLIK